MTGFVRRVVPHCGCLGVGVGMALLSGGRLGPLVGLATVAFAEWVVWRRGSSARRDADRRVHTDLPVAADLLAAALRAGAAPERAAVVVGTALGGPVGERLLTSGEMLRAGHPPAGAWRALGDLPGTRRVVRVLARSADSGAAVADGLVRVADDLRAARAADAETRARRAGVLVVLPLGFCFLPAFLLTGVVPAVVAVLDNVLER